MRYLFSLLLALFPIISTLSFAQSASCPVTSHKGNWSLRRPSPLANSEFGTTSLNGLIFAAGGFNEPNHHAFLIYNPGKDTWTQGPDLLHGAHHAAVNSLNQKVYVMGGMIVPHAVQIYDTVSRSWSTGRSLVNPRSAMASVVVNNKIHLIGGVRSINTGLALNTHDVYDPQTNSWQSRAPLPTPSEHVSAGFLNGRIYVVGGRNRFNNISLTQIYNPATNTWTRGADMNEARSGFGLVVFEKRIYVFGGEDLFGRNVVASAERYDPDLDRWELINSSPETVHGNPAAVSGRNIFVFGGSRFAASGDGTNFVQRLDISNSPKQPRNLKAQPASSTTVRLNWNASSTNEDFYLVQMKGPSTGFRTIAKLQSTFKSHIAQNLQPATTYTFRIIAQNGCGNSASLPAIATTRP